MMQFPSQWSAFKERDHVILLLSVGIPDDDAGTDDDDDDTDGDDAGTDDDDDGSGDLGVNFMILRERCHITVAPLAILPLRVVLAHYDVLGSDFKWSSTGLVQPVFVLEHLPEQLHMPYEQDLLEYRPRAWQLVGVSRHRQWRSGLSQSETVVAVSTATIEGAVIFRL